MANQIEERAYMCDVTTRKDEEHGCMLEGVPIIIGKRTDLGYWDEVIDAGALDQTDLKDVRFLVNHDTTQIPLARSRNNNKRSTMQLNVGDDGLHIRANLDTENNPKAKELYSAVSRGDVSGMSFMFTVNKDAWEGLDTEHPTRHIQEIGRVFEVSAVTFPAYEQTSINARSVEIGQASLESAKKALESAKKLDALRQEVLERSFAWKKN
ncbi:MAG: HK97 family phage prohead protease [Bulleidia sp.]